MFGVAQFMENGRLQVLAVPMNWIRKGCLMWPKSLSNEKIDQMRREGTAFNGATKSISVIVSRKFRSFQAAETSVEELSKKDVSDFEGKKKLLKSNHKKKSVQKRNDYNQLCKAIKNKEQQVSNTVAPPIRVSNNVPQFSLPSLVEQYPPLGCSSPLQSFQDQKPTLSTNLGEPLGPSSKATSSPKAPLEKLTPGSTLNMHQPSSSAGMIESQNNIIMLPYLGPVTSMGNQESITERDQELVEWMPEEMQVKALEITDPFEAQTNMDYTDVQTTGVEQTDTITDLDTLIKKNIVDAVNEIVPVAIQKYFDANIDKVVDRAVSAAVDRSFAMNFARLTAMTGVIKNTDTDADVRAEQHALIDTEKQLDDWNTDLAQDAVRKKYMEYFSKIIVPNSYNEKGDDAFYIISDCLFTRRFWNRFTWTGVNRGGKSERGFREFGNVTELLLRLVQIGDPIYTRLRLEQFCKTRLFRHAKSRSANKMLRKSSCRTKRSTKKKQTAKDIIDGDTDTSNAASLYSDDKDMGEFENPSLEENNETSEDESIDQESIANSDNSC